MTASHRIEIHRILVALFGVLAGFFAWGLIEWAESDPSDPHFVFATLTFFTLFFSTAMAMIGPLRFKSALGSAAVIAFPVTALSYWAAFRFADIGNFLETLHPFASIFVMGSIPMPFLIAHYRSDQNAFDYEHLFDNAWSIVVRVLAALAFMGIAWGVIFLSHVLLGLVGINLIEDLLDVDPIPMMITGGLIGLGVAVVYELADFISPQLILRLLRLLIPFVLLIVVVFIVALPLRGLSGLFGNLSVGAILMAVTFGGVTLVSTALDVHADQAVKTRGMKAMTQLLALLLPILAVLAVVAVLQRYAQYGWTPDRLAAFTLAVIAGFYAVFYASAVVLRGPWMHRIRKANIFMAGFVVAVCALWFTPLLNPQKISTNSQMARLISGQVDAKDFDYWDVFREWGTAGADAATQALSLDHPQSDVVASQTQLALDADNKWQFSSNENEVSQVDNKDRIRAVIQVFPTGRELPADFWTINDTYFFQNLAEDCERQHKGGRIPSCVAYIADFDHRFEGEEIAVVFKDSGSRYGAIYATRRGGSVLNRVTGAQLRLNEEIYDALAQGQGQLVPVQEQRLTVDGKIIDTYN